MKNMKEQLSNTIAGQNVVKGAERKKIWRPNCTLFYYFSQYIFAYYFTFFWESPVHYSKQIPYLNFPPQFFSLLHHNQ